MQEKSSELQGTAKPSSERSILGQKKNGSFILMTHLVINHRTDRNQERILKTNENLCKVLLKDCRALPVPIFLMSLSLVDLVILPNQLNSEGFNWPTLLISLKIFVYTRLDNLYFSFI